MAYVIADQFYAVAEPLLSRLDAAGFEGGVQLAASAPALVPVAAVNLAFALELYLKSLRVLLQLPDYDYHHLWGLYKSLPVSIKAEIEGAYAAAVEQKGEANLHTLKAIVARNAQGDTVAHPMFPDSGPVKTDVASVLTRSSNLFVAWRYTHESVRGAARSSGVYSFEHTALTLFRHALTQCIRRLAHEAPRPQVAATSGETTLNSPGAR